MLDHDDRLNIFTHVIGLVLATLGFMFLLQKNCSSSQILYACSLISAYFSSVLFHCFPNETTRIIDHISIYFLIAGTYTPLLLLFPTPWLIGLLFLVWVLAIGGIIHKIWSNSRFSFWASFIYLPLGWLGVAAINPMLETFPAHILTLIFLGGLFYSLGFYFFAFDHKKNYHGIWHLFVICGSLMHYLAVYNS